MDKFLQLVAKDIYNRYQNRLQHIAIVFPNKRAGIFFDNYLSQLNQDQPLWSPKYYTITQLFDQLSTLKADDPIATICLLHKIYNRVTGRETSLEYFYSWGQQLMADFNNIDKNMAPADQLLDNLRAAKQLEQIDNKVQHKLTAILEGKSRTELQNNFSDLWGKLKDIYNQLNKQLLDRGEAYAGARARRVVEQLEQGEGQLPEDLEMYAFVGFNVLLTTEQHLMAYLKREGKALFYWDTDKFFMDKPETFPFVRRLARNIETFGQALQEEDLDNISTQEIDFVSAQSDSGQAQFASDWLQAHLTKNLERNTAIVLCDETLLLPLLHAIPSYDPNQDKGVKEVNITKGFPLNQTQTFVQLTEKLGTALPDEDANKQLQAIGQLSQQFTELGHIYYDTEEDSRDWAKILGGEACYQVIKTLNRFHGLIEDQILQISNQGLRDLILQVLKEQSIPFNGQPASGLQVIGMLETRDLNFDQILMLSVNEGNVPKRSADHSFIPFDLRRAFHLTTYQDESEIYAYNFYRLLQRTRHITYVYSRAVTQDRQGEPSRFLLQLQACTDLPIQHFTLQEQQLSNHFPIRPISDSNNESIHSSQVQEITISPSAISDYLTCPLRYYFSRFANLRQPIVNDILLPANTFGSIFHDAMKLSYEQLTEQKQPDLYGTPVKSDDLKLLAQDNIRIDKIIKQAFDDVSISDYRRLGHGNVESIDEVPAEQRYDPHSQLVDYDVLKQYITQQLAADSRLSDLHIIEMEKAHYAHVTLDNGRWIKVGGQIDRIDVVRNEQGNPVLRIADYKTGAFNPKAVDAPQITEVFYPKQVSSHYIFQTFLYSHVIAEELRLAKQSNEASLLTSLRLQHLPIQPVLLFTRRANSQDYNPQLTIDSQPITNYVNQVEEPYLQQLKDVLYEMVTEPLNPTPNKGSCAFCPYQLLCERG